MDELSPPIEATGLFRFYHSGDEETVALRGVSLRVEPGEMVAVVGPSGSGKSTLLACLAGLDEPDGGTVQVSGNRMSRRPEAVKAALRAEHIGMLFQVTNLVAHLSVRQNVLLAQALRGDVDPPAADALLERLGLSGRSGGVLSELSGGEAARAGLAVSLANDPGLLLADEPTGEVDRHTEAGLMDLFRERAHRGRAVLVVTHSPIVAHAADRVMALTDGLLSDE
jgi:putative ABC transport system ATP-binding protein